MKETIFKAYDIRGTYPIEINEEVAYQIGQSYGSLLQTKYQKKKCVVGRDNRLSSKDLATNLIKGLLSTGINVIDYGEITTPMHYYTRYKENTYGIMVTASHNPKEDNGFKFSFDPLANARGQMIEDFKKYTFQKNFLTGKGMYEKRNIRLDYLNYLKDNISMGEKKLKVVIDAGNGVTTTIMKDAHRLFSNLDVTYICDENDGTFPNHHPDPAVAENMTMLKEKVLETKADIGIAYDGDGDRIGIVDNLGRYVMADQMMCIIAKDLSQKLSNKTFLCDVKCSKAFIDVVENLGGTVKMSRTGTSFTESSTKENHIPFGGELSGHLFFNDRGPEVCSAIYAGLRLLEILSYSKKTVADLVEEVPKYLTTPEIKIPVANEKKFQVVNQVLQYVKEKNYKYIDIDGVRVQFKHSWALVRASNTGPNLTLRFEAQNEEELEKRKQEFENVINTILGS